MGITITFAMAGPSKPKTSAFARQELSATKLIILPKCFMISFAIIGAISLIVGGVFLSSANSVIEADVRYDNAPQCLKPDGTMKTPCIVTITPEQTMGGPDQKFTCTTGSRIFTKTSKNT